MSGSNWQPTAGGSPSSSSTFRRSRFEPADDSNVSVNADQESFVVHRGKTVPTLNNVAVNANSSGDSGVSAGTPSRSRVAAIKERFNVDTKADERGESAGNGGGNGSSGSPAGVPSNWEDRKVSTYSGRRSRRNSITSDDSHLTIENFGGSQDNLSMFGRNPDKEPVTLSGRRPSIDMIAGATTPLTSDAMSAAGTPSNWRRSNNERNRSQVRTVQIIIYFLFKNLSEQTASNLQARWDRFNLTSPYFWAGTCQTARQRHHLFTNFSSLLLSPSYRKTYPTT